MAGNQYSASTGIASTKTTSKQPMTPPAGQIKTIMVEKDQYPAKDDQHSAKMPRHGGKVLRTELLAVPQELTSAIAIQDR